MKKIAILFSILLSFSAFSQEIDPGFEAVKSWKAIGTRWAVGYDKDNQILGLYDLSFAMPWTKVKVGSLSAPRVKAWDVVGMIKDGEIEPTDQDLSDKAVKELTDKKDIDLDGNLLPDNWKEQVPWKNSVRTQSNSFTLSDFDMQKSVKTKNIQKFNEELQYAQSLIKDSEDLQVLGDIFSQLRIVQDGKNFEIYFEPAVTESSALEVSKPKKIANIKNPKLSFLEAMRFELLKKSLGQLTKFIINPIVKAFVDTAISRVFHFVKIVNFSADHMALEVLADIVDQEGMFPKNILTEDDKVHMAESLQFAQSSLLMSWKWVFKKPYKEWTGNREDQIGYAINASEWLNDHNVNFVMLNPRFSVLDAKDLSLVALKKADKKKGPFRAYIEGKMSPYRGARIRTEIISAAVTFGTKFIPLVGGLLEELYKKVVENPVDKQRYWEARLSAVLEQRQVAYNEDWSKQLESLDGQRVDPFFKKRADVMKLIESRRQAFDIH